MFGRPRALVSLRARGRFLPTHVKGARPSTSLRLVAWLCFLFTFPPLEQKGLYGRNAVGITSSLPVKRRAALQTSTSQPDDRYVLEAVRTRTTQRGTKHITRLRYIPCAAERGMRREPRTGAGGDPLDVWSPVSPRRGGEELTSTRKVPVNYKQNIVD